MSPISLYFILMLDSINFLFGVAFLIPFMFIIVLGLIWLIDTGDTHDRMNLLFKNYYKKTITYFVLIMVISTFIPSTKQAIAIYAVPKIVNNEGLQQIPDKVIEVINNRLDEILKK